MRDSDLTLYVVNILAFMVSYTFDIEAFLRIVLLVLTILFTAFKIYDNVQNRKNRVKGDDD